MYKYSNQEEERKAIISRVNVKLYKKEEEKEFGFILSFLYNLIAK